MPASFASTDRESENGRRGNPQRFSSAENRSSALLTAAASIIGVTVIQFWWAPQHVSMPVPASTKAAIPVPRRAATAPVAAPLVAPVQYLPLTPNEATALNANKMPTGAVGPPAAPFRLPNSPVDSARALKCLTDAVYYEAASQDIAGQQAIAQVVLNRVRNPAFPANVCSVVYQGADRVTGCQFTFTCDGSLARAVSERAWLRARLVAKAALDGVVFKPIGYSTHYHAYWVVPYWASSLIRATNVGAHIFYRWKGAWGEPRAFKQRYAGAEPEPWLPGLRPQDTDLLRIGKLPTLNPSIGGPPPSVLRADSSQARLTPAADRALRGSSLRIDERRATLITALNVKPQIVFDQDSRTAP